MSHLFTEEFVELKNTLLVDSLLYLFDEPSALNNVNEKRVTWNARAEVSVVVLKLSLMTERGSCGSKLENWCVSSQSTVHRKNNTHIPYRYRTVYVYVKRKKEHGRDKNCEG